MKTFAAILAACLLAALVPGAARAGAIENAGSDLARVEASLGSLAARRASLQRELDEVAARIEVLKADRNRKKRLLAEGDLEGLLARSQGLADELAALSRQEDAATASRRAASERLLAAYDGSIAEARKAVASSPREKRPAVAQSLKTLKARREALRQELVARLGGPSGAPAALATPPTDDPDELLERADLVRDDRDRLARRIAEIDRRMREMQEEAEVDREVREFLSEGDLFDESDRVVKLGRTANPGKTVGIGPMPRRAPPGPDPAKAEPAATGGTPAAPPENSGAAGEANDQDGSLSGGTDPTAGGGGVQPPASPDDATGRDNEFGDYNTGAPISVGSPAPAPQTAPAGSVGTSPELVPAPAAATSGGSASGVLATTPEDLARSRLPLITGDESLEELARKRAALNRAARALSSQAEGLEARARDAAGRK